MTVLRQARKKLVNISVPNLVGRDDEVSALLELLDAPDQLPSIVVITGEPGIGKTALWLAAVDLAAARGFLVLPRALTGGGRSLIPGVDRHARRGGRRRLARAAAGPARGPGSRCCSATRRPPPIHVRWLPPSSARCGCSLPSAPLPRRRRRPVAGRGVALGDPICARAAAPRACSHRARSTRRVPEWVSRAVDESDYEQSMSRA